jgi:hypothetical protein
VFEFAIRATEKDPTGYYFPRWDEAEKLTIKAETKAGAITKVKKVLGETGSRRGWPWAITVDSIKEI